MELRWHKSSEEHIARHNVTWDEVTEAITPPTVSRLGRDGTTKVFGVTFNGRYLAMIVIPDEDEPTAYLITARDPGSKERALYRRRMRKG